MTNTLWGGCLCGNIRYQCHGEPITAVLCHCRDCQKAHAAPSAALACMPPLSITILQGSPAKIEMNAASGSRTFREFCPKCGTHLFSGSAGFQEFRAIKIATLDNPSVISPVAHVWVGSAVDWANIDDKLPTFEHQPEMSELEELWQRRSQRTL